jgi:hypothetical protein
MEKILYNSMTSLGTAATSAATAPRQKLAALFKPTVTSHCRRAVTCKCARAPWEASRGSYRPAPQSKATLQGGVHQVQFMDKTPRTNPELYQINLSNARKLK